MTDMRARHSELVLVAAEVVRRAGRIEDLGAEGQRHPAGRRTLPEHRQAPAAARRRNEPGRPGRRLLEFGDRPRVAGRVNHEARPHARAGPARAKGRKRSRWLRRARPGEPLDDLGRAKPVPGGRRRLRGRPVSMPRIGRVVGRGSVEQVIERANEAAALLEAPLVI